MNSGIISKEENMKQIKSKVDLTNIKSNYIIKKIFYIMEKNKNIAVNHLILWNKIKNGKVD